MNSINRIADIIEQINDINQIMEDLHDDDYYNSDMYDALYEDRLICDLERLTTELHKLQNQNYNDKS